MERRLILGEDFIFHHIFRQGLVFAFIEDTVIPDQQSPAVSYAGISELYVIGDKYGNTCPKAHAIFI